MSGSDYAVEDFMHAGYRVRILPDDDSPDSPREGVNLGTLVMWGRGGYGDRKPTEGERAAMMVYTAGGAPSPRVNWDALVKHLTRAGATVVLPVSMLDHSGVSVWVGNGPHWSDSAGWDSGLAGFIFDTASGREMCGTPPEFVEECLRGEVATYNAWLTGDVYGYVVTGPGADGKGCEDSCWGYYGIEDAIAEAKAVAEGCAADIAEMEARYLALAGRASAALAVSVARS